MMMEAQARWRGMGKKQELREVGVEKRRKEEGEKSLSIRFFLFQVLRKTEQKTRLRIAQNDSARPLLGLGLGPRVARDDHARGEEAGERSKSDGLTTTMRASDDKLTSPSASSTTKNEPRYQPYESKLIEFSKQEHKTDPKIKELNPRQQIPTFADETGAVVNESLAAVLYLDSTYKSSGTELVPSGESKEAAVARGAVYQRVFEAANLHAAMRDVIYPKMRNLLKTAEEEKEWADVKVEALKSELARWESYLTDNDDWLVPAASFSAADVAVAVLVLAIQRFGASLEGFPKLQKYAAKAAARESVASSWPPHWKEGEGPGFIKGML